MQNPTLEVFIKQSSNIRKAYAKLCFPSLAHFKFSPSEIDILIFLSNNPSINTSKQLVMYLDISKSLVCRSIDTLVERGLLVGEIDSTDRRIQRLSLSQKSQEVIQILKECQTSFSALITGDITPEDLLKTQEVLEHIAKNIEHIQNGGITDECK